MSFFSRWKHLLEKANPYHDELGRFTEAENAVTFSRPKSGYHDGELTADPNWRGLYDLNRPGSRYEPRRREGYEGAQQELPFGSASEAGDPYDSDELTPVTYSPGFSTTKSSVEQALRAALPSGYYDSAGPNGISWGNTVDRLALAGFNTKPNGLAGINQSITIKTSDGKAQLKWVNDSYGIGAEGEALGPVLINSLGIRVRTQEAHFLDVTDPAINLAASDDLHQYALTEWVDGRNIGDHSEFRIRSAIENTGEQEVMKLVMFEALAGDSDKHRNNYIISDERTIVGMDYSRLGDYESSRGRDHAFQSTILNTWYGTSENGNLLESVSTAGLARYLDRAKKMVEKHVLPLIPDRQVDAVDDRRGGRELRRRRENGERLFLTDGRARAREIMNERYDILRSLVDHADLVQNGRLYVEDVRRALATNSTDPKVWAGAHKAWAYQV